MERRRVLPRNFGNERRELECEPDIKRLIVWVSCARNPSCEEYQSAPLTIEYTFSLTMPRVVHRAVRSELRNAILTATPKRTMLMHIPDNDALILRRIRIGRVEVLIGDGCPTHATLAGTIDDACVNLAEAGLDVVVESRADVDTSRPHLDVTNDAVRIARCADVEANEVVEFEILARVRVSWVRKDQMSVGCTLNLPFAQERSSTLTQGKSMARTSAGARSGKILWALSWLISEYGGAPEVVDFLMRRKAAPAVPE